MSYQVQTAVFEGPLELLLQLITRREVDISELSLVDLVAEYLQHVQAMEQLDLEVASEFLLIASTLVQLKARRLLPEDRSLDLDEELALIEERDRLLARLLACATFKDVAAVLGHRLAATARFVPREVGLDREVIPRAPAVTMPIGAEELARLAGRTLGRSKALDLDHLDLELPSVDEALADLQSRISQALEADFAELTAHCRRKAEVVAYFLAMLELARWGMVQLSQDGSSSEITVRRPQPGLQESA
jgi:segregation and condensation protein A